MKGIPKKIITGFMAVTLFLGVYLPTRFQAQALTTETPFGGLQLFVLGSSFCSCSGSNVHFIYDYKSKGLKMLYKGASSKVYKNKKLGAAASYQKGTYSSGSTACTMDMGPYDPCQEWFSPEGTYGNQPGTGTSMLDTTGELLADSLRPFVKNIL